MANFNYWQPKGALISHSTNFWPGQPTVLYEGNSQLGFSGNVFKIWYCNGNTGGTTGTYYAEWDGTTLTESPSNPIVASYGFGPKVFKHGTTYYLYAQTSWAATAIAVLTSPDGVTWTLQNASAITPDSGYDSCNQMGVIGPDGNGKFWGYYDDVVSGTSFDCGRAQSTDLIHWTQDGVITPALSTGTLASGATWNGSGNLTFAQVGSTYYAWSQTTVQDAPWVAVWDTPSDILRWSAPAPSGPWTPNGNLTYYRTLSNEGIGLSTAVAFGQCADPSIVAANGNVYIFYTATPDGRATTGTSRTFDINYAVVPSMSIGQLVQTNEGVQNIPAPFPGAAGTQSLSLNFATLASDNFVRGSLGANWSQAYVGAGFGIPTITSNKVTCATQVFADAFYNPVTWPNDQWSQITVQAGTTATNSQQWNALVRTNISASGALYEAIIFGYRNTGQTVYLQKYAAGGGGTNLANFAGITVATGDKICAAVVGTKLCFYYNGFLLIVISDSSVTSGAAGMGLKPEGSGFTTSLNGWSAGGFAYPSTGSGIGKSVARLRRTRRRI